MDVKKLSDGLAAAVKQLVAGRDALARLQRQCAEVESQIESLEAEKSLIQGGCANREDFLEALCAQVDRFAEEGRRNIRGQVKAHLSRANGGAKNYVPAENFSWDRLKNISLAEADFTGNAVEHLTIAIAPGAIWNQFERAFGMVGLCTLFGDQIKASLAKSLESFEWPYPQAASTPDRIRRLEEIEGQLKPLRAQRIALQEAIETVEEPAR